MQRPNLALARWLILLVMAATAAACTQKDPKPTNESTSAETSEVAQDMELISRESEAAPADTPFEEKSSETAGNLMDDGLTLTNMYDLTGPDQERAQQALQAIVSSSDSRFVAVLIELLRAFQLGLVTHDLDTTVALQQLSDQNFGNSWPDWVSWYGSSDLEPPPGFTGWKGQLLSKIDLEFAGFLTDDHPSRIRTEEVLWGGVAVDGIPPLEFAPTIPGAKATYLLDEDPVFGIEINGDARAYPLRIIDNHEMSNDVIGGVPVSLSYCTLCGAAIAYDGRVTDTISTTFGTSGFLYRSNKLMYDRETRTLWNQLTGEPVLGKLAGSEIRLEILPLVLTTWKEWVMQHPETLVLDNDTGIYPPYFYQPGILYGNYFASGDTMFPVWQRSDLLPDKEFVYTLFVDGVPKAYTIQALTEERVVNDQIGANPIVLIAGTESIDVEGYHRFEGPVTYTHGGEVRAYERGGHHFSPGPETGTLLNGANGLWQVEEDRLLGPGGEILARIPGHLAYWFGWYAFFPETLLYPESTVE